MATASRAEVARVHVRGRNGFPSCAPLGPLDLPYGPDVVPDVPEACLSILKCRDSALSLLRDG